MWQNVALRDVNDRGASCYPYRYEVNPMGGKQYERAEWLKTSMESKPKVLYEMPNLILLNLLLPKNIYNRM